MLIAINSQGLYVIDPVNVVSHEGSSLVYTSNDGDGGVVVDPSTELICISDIFLMICILI